MEPIFTEVRMLQQRLKKSQVCRDAFNAKLAQRSIGFIHRFLEIWGWRMHDEFRQQ